MSIEDRIQFYLDHKTRWENEKEMLENKLDIANRKIISHWTAIQNLAVKKSKLKKEYL